MELINAFLIPIDIMNWMSIFIAIRRHKISDLSNMRVIVAVLFYEAKQGCPLFTTSKLIRFFEKYSFLWGAGLIILGTFLAFSGNHFINIVIYIITTIAVFCLITALTFDWIMKKVKKDWIYWMFVIVAFILANVCGFLLVKFRRIGCAVLAAFGGVML